MEIHQFVPDFSYGDAIGNDAIGIQRILRSWEIESKIFSKVIHPMYWNKAEFYLYYRYPILCEIFPRGKSSSTTTSPPLDTSKR
ncbi:MAG: hypothetical protein JRJ48_00320 [Deltaproteobacteria bacterium]|nr:hypothetical protein [Deltaproteobacteria bacterium]